MFNITVPNMSQSFILFPSAGQYVFEVRCVSNPSLLLRTTEKTKVDPPPMDRSEIGQVFDDFDKMLQFDI